MTATHLNLAAYQPTVIDTSRNRLTRQLRDATTSDEIDRLTAMLDVIQGQYEDAPWPRYLNVVGGRVHRESVDGTAWCGTVPSEARQATIAAYSGLTASEVAVALLRRIVPGSLCGLCYPQRPICPGSGTYPPPAFNLKRGDRVCWTCTREIQMTLTRGLAVHTL